MDFFKKFLFKRDLGLSIEETLPFWTIFILILSFDITLTALFAVLIIRGHYSADTIISVHLSKTGANTAFNASYKTGWAQKIGLPS